MTVFFRRALARRMASYLTGLASLLLAAGLAQADPAIGDFAGFQQLSAQRIGRSVTQYEYQATVTNDAPELANVTALVTSSSPDTVIIDDSLDFGSLAVGASATSSDSFSFQQNRRVPFDPAVLQYQFQFDVVVLNSPPTADAGPDQTAFVNQAVTLDGSGSSDPDGDPLSFSWSLTGQPAGSTATLDDPAAVTPSFTLDQPGRYTAELIVNDGSEDSAPDSVTIDTLNSPPVADAGPDQTAFVTDSVTLDGSGSSDVDGDPLTFFWVLTSRPLGSGTALDDPTAVMPSFEIDRPGSYVAELTVNDGSEDSAPDSVTIDTLNSPPVADAGAGQTVLVTETVTLDGSGSSDVDGDLLDFFWSLAALPAGSTAILSDPAAVMPSFDVDLPGTYVLQLIVNDGLLDSAPDTVTIDTENSPPVADAGPDQTVFVTEIVTLDASGSSDVDGDLLSQRWSFTAQPAGSSALLSNPGAIMPTFEVDLPGTYVLQLIVNDGTVDSDPDSVTIVTENSAPVANAGPDQTVFVTDTVALDGSGSSDVDGDLLSFAWSFTALPAGSLAGLDDPLSETPSFEVDLPGTYVAQLIVNDGSLDSDPNNVIIVTENSPPVAQAGASRNITFGATASFDGSLSSDPDNDPLIYRWRLVSVPAGSAATLDDPAAVTPSFVADVLGDYVAELVVNDGALGSLPDTVTLTAEPLGTLTAFSRTIGAGLQFDGSGAGLDITNHGGVTLRIESNDPTVVLIAPDGATPGSAFIDVFVADGSGFAPYAVQAVAGARGTVTVTASAPGFIGGEGSIAVVEPAVGFFSLSSNTALGVNDGFVVRIGVPNAAGTALSSFQQASAANDPPLEMTVTSSDGTVGQMSFGGATGATIPIAVPAQSFQFNVTFITEATGSTTVSSSIPGFLTLTIGSQTVTVEPPTLTARAHTIGAGLQVATSSTLGITDHGGVTVRIESSNPAIALIAPDSVTPGAPFIDVAVANGSRSAPYVIQGVAAAQGTATVTVSAPGFTSAQATMTVAQPAVALFGLSGTPSVGTNDGFLILLGLPNSNGTGIGTLQRVSAANLPPLALTVTSSDGAVGQIDDGSTTATTVVVNLAANVLQPGFTFVPQAAGSTTVTASIPGFLTTTAGTQDLTVDPPGFAIFSRSIGAALQFADSASLDIANHGGITVRVASSDPTLALIAPDSLTSGSAFIDVNVPNGSSSAAYVVQGVAGTTGTATVTLSAPGFTDGVSTITVAQPAVALTALSSAPTVGVNDGFLVLLGLPNGAGTGLSTLQRASAANLPPLELTLSSSSAAVGQISDGTTTAASITVTVPADAFQLAPTFVPLATGSTTVTSSIPGFVSTTAASLAVTVSGP